MKKLIFFLLIAITSLSCEKEGDTGHAMIHAGVMSQHRYLQNATVYIKYGAKEFPGPDIKNYDDMRVTDWTGHVVFHNLSYGDYYLYAKGYDSLLQVNVSGGIPVRIEPKDRFEEAEAMIPVQE